MKKIKKLMLVVLFLMFGLVLFSCEKKTHGDGVDLFTARQIETLDTRYIERTTLNREIDIAIGGKIEKIERAERDIEKVNESVRKLETDKIIEKQELEKQCEKFKQELETLKQELKDLQEKKLVNLEERLKITEQKIALLESVNYDTQIQALQTKNAELETEVLALKEELTKEVWIPVYNVSYLWVKYKQFNETAFRTRKIDITFGDTILYNPKTGDLKITIHNYQYSFYQKVFAFGMWGFAFES